MSIKGRCRGSDIFCGANDESGDPRDGSDPNLVKDHERVGIHGITHRSDEDQSVGKAYGAICTPDFFGLNAQGELQYRGRLDSAAMGDPTGRTRELVDAMMMIAETGKGPEHQTPRVYLH